MSEHTPTPWKVRYDEGTKFEDDKGNMIGMLSHVSTHGRRFSGEVEANAAFIVRAVNSHDALVKALRAVTGYLMNAQIDLRTNAPKATALGTIEGGLKIAHAALAAVKDAE